MAENTDHNELFRNSRSFSDEEDDSNFLSDLDFIKFLIVAKRNLVWVLFILAAGISAAYLYLRYTSPVYQSSAILKLEIKSKSDLVNLNSPEVNAYHINDLSGEIELIKSNLVLSQVAEKLRLDVSYYAQGKILNEERYHTSPFVISSYMMETDNMYNQNIYVEILNKTEYLVNAGQDPPKKYLYGEEVILNELHFVLNLNGPYKEDLKANTYFFIINHKTTQQNYLISRLNVDVLNPDAGTLSITFKDNNAAKARDIVNMIDSVYLKEGLADKYRSSEQTIKYLEEHIKENEANMERYEKDIQNFIVKNKSTDLKSEVVKNIVEIERLDKQLLVLREKQIKLDEMFDLISNDKKTEDLIVIGPEKDIPQMNEILHKYNELKKQRELLLLSNKEGTMVLRLNTMEMNSLKNQTVKVISQVKKNVFEEMAEMNITKKKLEDAIYTATPKDNDLKKIQRLYGFYERLYLLAFDKKVEFEITKASTVPSFRVLSPPSYSKVPIYPVQGTVYGYAIGIALVLSFLLVVLQYFLHNTIDNVGELEKSTIAPVLGFVPKYLKGKMEHSVLVIDKSPKGPITEALRTIRTNIEFMLPNKGKRIISVTSTVSGEGKTFVSINLAGVIALSGQKVIIIDMDMRKPKIHKAFEDENNMGVSTILINKHDFTECIKPTSIENLFYIPSGPIPPNPSELIISEEFDHMLDHLKEKFDVIILDSPPVGLVTDGVLIMKKVDLPIYVIRAEYSKKGYEKNANRLVTKNNFKKLSIILNDFSNLSSYGYGYKYGYGYGYGYYSNGEDDKPNKGLPAWLRKKLRKA